MLSIYVAPILSKASETILNAVNARRKSGRKILILTPDRMNFDMQSRIFDVLNEKSLFDVEVNTLTRVVAKFLSSKGLSKEVLTKQAGVAIIKSLLNRYQDQLTSFYKSSKYDGFASTLYEMICMFKSCNLQPGEIVEKTNSTLLNQKLRDISFIYSKYEEFLQDEITDSFNRLDLFCQLIKKDDFENMDICFVGFEDLTNKILQIVLKLSTFTQVSISCAYQKKDECRNWSLYRNAPYLTILDAVQTKGVASEVVPCQLELSDEKYLSQNLFGVTSKKNQLTSYTYHIWQADNIEDEISYVLRRIGFDVVSKQSTYDDHVIMLSNFNKYKNLLLSQSKKCQIPLYLDETISFSEHSYVRLVFDLLECIEECTSSQFIHLLKQDIFGCSIEDVAKLENLVQYYGVKTISEQFLKEHLSSDTCESIIDWYHKFHTFSSSVKQCKTYAELITWMKGVLNQIQYISYLEKQSFVLMEEKQYELSRTTAQVFKKWEIVFAEIEKFLADEECGFGGFQSVLKAMVKDMTISLPPVTHHSVKVLDLTKSQLSNAKNIYYIGVNASAFPEILSDNGIITDVEISKLSYAKRLGPTIAQLNERVKRKVLDCVVASKNAYFSYISSDEQGNTCLPATIIEQFISLLGIKTIQITPMLDVASIVKMEDKPLLLMNNFSFPLVKDTYLSLIKENNHSFQLKYLSLFRKLCEHNDYLERYYDPYVRHQIQNAKQLFFAKNKTSVSQLEKYASCPYQHFISYGLRLKQNEDSVLTGRIFGDILHMFCLRFVSYLKKVKDIDKTKGVSVATTMFEDILKGEDYKRFVNDDRNYYTIQGLYDEMKRLALFIMEEREFSHYQPVVLEGVFDGDLITLGEGDQKISIHGKIDRVDSCGSLFRVIDYKTGVDTFSYTDVASGKKLQLLVYVLAYQRQKGGVATSASYLPIRNSFSKTENGVYQLDGIIPNDKNQLLDMDSRLCDNNYKSNIVKVSVKADGNLSLANEFMVDNDTLNKITEYALHKLESQYEEILKGDIKPRPLKSGGKSACDYCSYLPMCKFSNLKGDQERLVEKQKLIDILKEENDEING